MNTHIYDKEVEEGLLRMWKKLSDGSWGIGEGKEGRCSKHLIHINENIIIKHTIQHTN